MYMEKECAIKIGMNPHPWDNEDKPYYWVILVNDCNEGFGWSKNPEQAWKDANEYYKKVLRKKRGVLNYGY